jgi:hypothetical protein
MAKRKLDLVQRGPAFVRQLRVGSSKVMGGNKYVVTGLAWGKPCVDCGDVRDYYMVRNDVWKDAGLEPNQCCCCKCLAMRLGRPLERGDFTNCLANTWGNASP